MAYYVRCKDIKDKSKLNRINYLFRKKKIKKYIDNESYVCFDLDQYESVVNEKRGRKI